MLITLISYIAQYVSFADRIAAKNAGCGEDRDMTEEALGNRLTNCWEGAGQI